ncbi:SUMF1/EgtB/PvdO family nonheme iron enzyme [Micromonospora sp. B11E3]|uniref:formylglycine-generating enzyme family protein n=1 Tax=Micromonospora sp. B11E3 TaxID=3153562 RepID=UPI00325EFD8A
MTLGIFSRPCAEIRAMLLDDAIPIGAGRRLLRSPITAVQAASILNTMPIRDDPNDSYTNVNVINPDNTITYDAAGYRPVVGRENHPVTGVSWFGAQAMAEQVGARLPTVDEWHQVIQAHRSRFPWGNAAPSPELANFDEHIGRTSPTREFRPSLLGFYDLLGNVGEWCDLRNESSDEAPVVGGGWNKPIGAQWHMPRWKWRRIGTVSIGLRFLFDTGEPR